MPNFNNRCNFATAPVEKQFSNDIKVKMGFFQMIANAIGWSKNGRVLVVGLDNSGKSTLIHHLKPDKVRFQFTISIYFKVSLYFHLLFFI